MNSDLIGDNDSGESVTGSAQCRTRGYVFALFAWFSVVVLCVHPSAFAVAAINPARGDPPFIVGVNTHIDRQGRNYRRALQLAKDAAVDSVRFDASWASVERKKGVLQVPARLDGIVDAANRAGIKVLMILDYGNRWHEHGAKPTTPAAVAALTRYAGVLASHFKGKVYAYEVWNEWDDTAGNTQPGTPSAYLWVLTAVYPVLKRSDPGALVLGGSVTSRAIHDGYLAELIRLGALKHMDGLSLHPYVQCEQQSSVAAWKSWMISIEHQLTGLAYRPVPMYVTEIGWPSSVGQCGVSTVIQAKRAHNVVIAAHALGFVRGVWWYDLRDNGSSRSDAQDQFGLVNSDWVPKPAFAALKAAIRDIR